MPEFETRDEFVPGDVVRFRNGFSVIVDAIVQVGRPPAYGYAHHVSEYLVVAEYGCTDGQHIAPDVYQNDDGPRDKFAMTRGSNDRNRSFLPPESVLEKNPADHGYEIVTSDDVLDPEDVIDFKLLDERMYQE